MPKAVVLLSGGFDSTALLHHAVSAGWDCEALSISYGQRHKKELEYAARTCEKLGVKHHLGNLNCRSLFGNSCLTSDSEMPKGHHEDPRMVATVVPNRNMILIALAGSLASTIGAKRIAVACHQGDFAIYADCRKVFLDATSVALRLATESDVSVWYPFSKFSKTDIVKLSRSLGVNDDESWTCYKGEALPCGECSACTERESAIAEANE